MKLSNTIHRLISAFLIIVFALSITPVVILHKLTANHKDISYDDKNQKGDQYAKAGINCNCINFVAEAQFLNTFTVFSCTAPVSVSSFQILYTEAFYSRHHFFAELRGPPFSA